MALSRNRRHGASVDYWPGFVDALSTLLLAIMFLLSVFMVVQHLLSNEVLNKDDALAQLNAQIAELTQQLGLERSENMDLQQNLSLLSASLASAEQEKSRLESLLTQHANETTNANQQIGQLQGELDQQQQISAQAAAQVELLNQQISALRRQIAALEDALDASEQRDRESNAQIADLGKRLNVALAQRVQELNRYRSDFFGRLRQILSDKQNIRIVGDRFVFQSEVLFASGSADLNNAGQQEMEKLAQAIIQLEAEIPDDIPWVLRVDGHTDNQPLSGMGRYRDNWELSTARATSVVKYLIAHGVNAQHLVAAGFGEYQPLEPNDSDEAKARNRRIELKLTER